MHLALTGIFRAHWSAEVHDEWIRNLLKNRPDISRETNWNALDSLMDQAACRMRRCDGLSIRLLNPLELPDRDDRHVLAAAIRCGASVIVTLNLADFPSSRSRQL